MSGRSRFRLRSLSVLISSGVLATRRGPDADVDVDAHADVVIVVVVGRSRLCFR